MNQIKKKKNKKRIPQENDRDFVLPKPLVNVQIYTYVWYDKIWPVLKLDVGGARTYMSKKVVDIYG